MATMTADEYREIVKAIIKTATGSGSVSGSYPWNALNNGNYSAQDFYNLMHTQAVKNAGYDAVLNADGSVRTYTYINKNGQIADLGSYDDIAGAFNSNYQTGTASGGTIQFTQIADTKVNEPNETVSHSWIGTTGKLSHYDKGIKGTGEFVFGSVLPAIGAASTGIALGKIIDKGIYELGTNVFGSDKLEAFNPDTWGTITAGDDSLGAKAFNTIFGINPDTGNTQMYMDENAFAYMAMYLQSIGVFGKKEFSPTENLQTGDIKINGFESRESVLERFLKNASDEAKNIVNINYSRILAQFSEYPNYQQVEIWYNRPLLRVFISETNYPISAYYTHSNETYSFRANRVKQWYNTDINYNDRSTEIFTITGHQSGYSGNNCYSRIGTYTSSNIDGIGTQDGATTPDLSNVNTIEEALNALKNQYPELWDNRVENSVVQPDGTTKTYTYIPVPMPTGGTADQPTTEGAKQSNSEVDPSTATDTLLKTLVQILTQTKPVGMTDTPTDPINPNPPDIGGGDTPVVVVPTGSANALYSIYNPSQSQLNSFGAWLWSSNFVDQLLKLFNDPMQAIIGLHKVFAIPPISGSGTIKVGYLDSGVDSNIVGNQYTTVDCGSVNLYEYYGNVFDYDPFTKVNLYLPFIGIVPLNVGEIMRSTIHIIYHVDVLTGACLAEVKIKRDSAGGTLFQYSGNAAVQYPISSGSYMGIISGIMSIAGGVAGTIATGGAAMPVLLGAGASVGRMHTDISHSGSFSGNAGAMGIKKPYLIIDRPQTAMANEFNKYIGYPSNFTATLGSCGGFVKVLECHLENINATKSELDEIDSMLKEGVII